MRPLRGLIRPFKGLIRPFKAIIQFLFCFRLRKGNRHGSGEGEGEVGCGVGELSSWKKLFRGALRGWGPGGGPQKTSLGCWKVFGCMFWTWNDRTILGTTTNEKWPSGAIRVYDGRGL